jgi:phosphoribosyl-ATP pyrophosphohydrolase
MSTKASIAHPVTRVALDDTFAVRPRCEALARAGRTSATTADELQRFAHNPPHCASEANSEEIPRLYAALELVNERTHPRTAHLLASGVKKMAQKVMEEAGEVAIEAVRRRRPAVVRESADLIYNLVVLWRECGIEPNEIWAEMSQRATDIGIAEKMPKRPKARF